MAYVKTHTGFPSGYRSLWPGDRGGVFDATLRLAVALEAIAGRKRRLAHDLCDDLVVEEPRLELATEMGSVPVTV